MSDNSFDDFLRNQLQASNNYIDDAGFSAQVMAGLPSPKRRLNRWLEMLIIAAPVTLIAFLIASQFSAREVIQPIYAWVLTMDIAKLISFSMTAGAVMLAISLYLIFKPRSLL